MIPENKSIPYDEEATQLIINDSDLSRYVQDNWSRAMVDCAVYSVIGGRSEQQDAISCCESKDYDRYNKMIGVLCDGMGGLNGGARVSRICADVIFHAFFDKSDELTYSEFFRDGITKLDKKVAAMTDADGKPLRGGSTLVAVAIDDGNLHWASIGDSRIYLFRAGILRQITRDHNFLSVLKEQVARGEMTMEAAMQHPKKEALISFIGMNGIRIVDTNPQPFKLVSGDYLLLCSDGLYRALSEMEMVQALLENELSMQRAVEAMIDMVHNKHLRNQDNTSVIAIHYQ